jgi:hypothetical protein
MASFGGIPISGLLESGIGMPYRSCLFAVSLNGGGHARMVSSPHAALLLEVKS